MKRYWVSFWSAAGHESEYVPFPSWVTGQREGQSYSYCAVIDAESEAAVWALVSQHFPDAERRFCEEREEGWEPGDRFPKEP